MTISQVFGRENMAGDNNELPGNDSMEPVIKYTQYFEVDSDIVLANPHLRVFFKEVDSIMRIDTITAVDIKGYASIDGGEKLNERLSKARAEAMAKQLVKSTDLPMNLISIKGEGENWEKFKELVKADKNIPMHEEVVGIVFSNLSPSAKESRLRYLDNGKVWKYLAANTFPSLRNVDLTLDVKHRFIKPAEIDEPVPENNLQPEEEVEIIEEETVEIPEPVVIEEVAATPEEWRRRMYIKTDLPYWLMTWSNVAFEVDLAPHWSFNLPIYFSALNYFKHTIKFRTFSFQPGVRYWFKGENKGAYLEAHYGMGWWNFAFNGDYRYQDHYRKTPTMGGGVAAGYRLPVSKNGRWAMEFGGGVGVYRLNYDRFQNRYNGKLIDSHKKTVFFIDNINISISYSFPIEKKKGGDK